MPAIRPGGEFAHEALNVPGCWGYASPFSIEAGDEVGLRISNDEQVKVKVYRLVSPTTQKNDVLLQSSTLLPNQQPIYPSSYVAIKDNVKSCFVNGFSIEVWIRPFIDNSKKWSGIITQFARCTQDETKSKCGFGLFIEQNQVVLYLGDGKAFDKKRVFVHQESLCFKTWYHICAVWNPVSETPVMMSVTPAKASSALKYQVWDTKITEVRGGQTHLRFGAAGTIAGESEFASNFASLDMAMPVIYNRVLSKDEIEERFYAKARVAPDFEDTPDCLEGCWKLDEEKGNYIADISNHKRTGTIINRGTWRIGGPCSDAKELKVPLDPLQFGHGLRVQQDELVDCEWKVSITCKIPHNSPPGIYAAKIFSMKKEMKYSIFFNVRAKRAESVPVSPIAVLSSSHTWLAYSRCFNILDFQDCRCPSYDLYNSHSSGAVAYTRSYNLPLHRNIMLVYQPGYHELIKMERYAHHWLTQNGYEFDSLTDLDLSTNPAILEGHKVLIIVGHSEYWTLEAFAAVRKFLDNGGKVIGLTGNTMYWRVSLDDDNVVMEGRKLPDPLLSAREGMGIGESVHQNDGKISGLAGQSGMPTEEVLGVTSCGWNIYGLTWDFVDRESMYPPQYASDYAKDIDHILKGVSYETFGFGDGEDGSGKTGCVMHEGDVPLDYIFQCPLTYPSRPPAVIARTKTDTLELIAVEYSGNLIEKVGALKYASTVTYWKRPNGGSVFHMGCIGAAWGLYYDTNMQTMIKNVLDLFSIPK